MNRPVPENIKRFKTKLTSVKRSRRFVRWGEARGFAAELRNLLEELNSAAVEPRVGAELMAAFYQIDRNVFDRCDDSSGYVGDVFRYEAKDLFVDYASRCEDKAWLVKLVLKLNRQDDYGVRDTLIDCAAEYLPEANIREMIQRLQSLAEQESGEFERNRWLRGVEMLARQIKDGPLFEKTRIATWRKLNSAALVDIASVYLDSGDERTALDRLEQIPAQEMFMADERDKLLLKIHGKLGNKEKQTETAWLIFRRCRSVISLRTLLAVLGEEQRNSVIASEADAILVEDSLSYTNAAFLIDVEQLAAAENYLLDRADQLNGDYYQSLLPLAEALETEGRPLAATILYRALLDSILRRAQTKTYYYGARYLKKLDRFAKRISDWSGFIDHAGYKENLQQQHGRKKSFWAKYGA